MFRNGAHLLRARTGALPVVLLAAALMIVSGLVHIHLWDIAYRHVPTLGPLFLVQAIAALVGAAALAASRAVVVAVGSALLMAGTIVGFVLAATIGIFNFKLPEITGWADAALVSESLAVLLLAGVLVRHVRTLEARPA